jgi:2-dehydropantoate 2-reductase
MCSLVSPVEFLMDKLGTEMRYAILGAGGVGSAFGGFLALAGVDVTLVDIRADHVDTVNRDGLRITWADSSEEVERISRPRAMTDVQSGEHFDVVLVATKGYAVERAAGALRPAVSSTTWWATLLNGLDHDLTVAAIYGPDRVLGGTTTVGAELRAPGHVHVTAAAAKGESATHLGCPRTSSDIPEGGRRVADTLTSAGLPTLIDPNTDLVIWTKLAQAASMGPLSAILRRTIADVWDQPEGRRLTRRIFDEVISVAHAEDIPLDADVLWAKQELVLAAAGQHYASITVDVLRGAKTEVDSWSGAIVKRARKHDLDVPMTELMAGMLRLLEIPSGRTDALPGDKP